jgi:hypothetical protein
MKIREALHPSQLITGWNVGDPATIAQAEHDREAGNAALAREAMAETKMFSGRERPPAETYQPKALVLPEGFNEERARIAASILTAGLPVDKEKLLAFGRETFRELLGADLACRGSRGSWLDYTRFDEIADYFMQSGGWRIPSPLVLSPKERMRGGAQAEAKIAAGAIDDITDLWKAAGSDWEARAVHSFASKFQSLCFAGSILARMSDDGRVRSAFFVSGFNVNSGRSSRSARLFDAWRSCFTPVTSADSFLILSLPALTPALAAWLADDAGLAEASSKANFYERLASVLLDHRIPDREEISLTRAVLDGYCLGADVNVLDHDSLALESWLHVGEATQASADLYCLSQYRRTLVSYFPAIHTWLAKSIPPFYKPVRNDQYVGTTYGFDSAGFREHIGRLFSRTKNDIVMLASSATVEAIAESKSSKLVAILPNELVIETSLRGAPRNQLSERIASVLNTKLSAAGVSLPFNVEPKESL